MADPKDETKDQPKAVEPKADEAKAEPKDAPKADDAADEPTPPHTYTVQDGQALDHEGEHYSAGDSVTFTDADVEALVVSDLQSRGIIR